MLHGKGEFEPQTDAERRLFDDCTLIYDALTTYSFGGDMPLYGHYCRMLRNGRTISQVLDVIRKRLDQATQTVDDAAIRTRAIERRLKNVDTEDGDESNVIRLANAG